LDVSIVVDPKKEASMSKVVQQAMCKIASYSTPSATTL